MVSFLQAPSEPFSTEAPRRRPLFTALWALSPMGSDHLNWWSDVRPDLVSRPRTLDQLGDDPRGPGGRPRLHGLRGRTLESADHRLRDPLRRRRVEVHAAPR